MEKKKVDEFWRIPEVMPHLEDDLCLETTYSLLLLGNDSLRKTSYHKHNKTSFWE